jgi:uncharacterized coiled-coil DUF342 family protein
MSTSPSWFDQEKFSRLVKKVGKTTTQQAGASPTASQPLPPVPAASQPLPQAPSASQPLPPSPTGSQPLPPNPTSSQALPPVPAASQKLPEMEDESIIGEPAPTIASTARISLVSKPPSLFAEQRSLPALPRRTTPLPGLKTLFQNSADGTVAPPVVEMPSVITQPLPEAPSVKSDEPSDEPVPAATKALDPLTAGDDDLAGIWQKMALLNEELAQTIHERDHALSDINQMRDQLRLADELVEKNRGAAFDDVAQLTRERDEAHAELKTLKDKPVPAKGDSQKVQLPDGVTKTKELVFLTQERDQARKEYSELRKQFEGYKREQSPSGPPPLPRDDSAKLRGLEQQLEGFRLKLEEKNKEIAELKAAPPSLPPPLPVVLPNVSSEDEEKLKGEITALKGQVTKFKEDASIASRGLALSQKALQETREALREATEGTSLSRHNFDNLKNECASLTQQNTVLQAQNEQLSRELASAKQRQSGRIQM